jgi:hypothetical protein
MIAIRKIKLAGISHMHFTETLLLLWDNYSTLSGPIKSTIYGNTACVETDRLSWSLNPPIIAIKRIL